MTADSTTPREAARKHGFFGSLWGPIDPATYDKDAGWRWVSWGRWGRAERILKLIAYLLGTAAPIVLWQDGTWGFGGPSDATGTMQLAGWLLLLLLTPLQILDIRDRWLIRDYLSNLTNIPRTLSHPLMGLMLLYAPPVDRIDVPVFLYGALLLLALSCEGVFLWKHLGREHRHPGGVPNAVFWGFLAVYVAVYAVVVRAAAVF